MRAAVKTRHLEAVEADIDRRMHALIQATSAASLAPAGQLVVRDGARTLVLPLDEVEVTD